MIKRKLNKDEKIRYILMMSKFAADITMILGFFLIIAIFCVKLLL